MKKVLLSSAVALSLFAAAAPVFAEGTASLWVNDIDNNEVPQGSTDSESNKVMDELQAYRDAQSALDQQVAEAKKAPVGKSQAGNKVLVIGEGESANADQPSVAPSTTDPSTPAYSAAPYSTASSSVPTFPAPSQSSAASSSAVGKKKAKKSENKAKKAPEAKEENKENEENSEEKSLPKTSAVK